MLRPPLQYSKYIYFLHNLVNETNNVTKIAIRWPNQISQNTYIILKFKTCVNNNVNSTGFFKMTYIIKSYFIKQNNYQNIQYFLNS